MKTLRLFNGRCYGFKHEGREVAAFCVAGYSVADVMRLLEQVGYHGGTRTEITQYFSECWGNNMAAVTPVRGVWVTYKEDRYSITPPTRIL